MKNIKLIAETAWHHEGDPGFFEKIIEDIALKTSTDYIKFHITIDWDEYFHPDHQLYYMLKDKLFDESQWDYFISIVDKYHKKVMLLFNDTSAVEFGMKYEPELVEIHSACLNDENLLFSLKSNLSDSTRVVLGVGGSTIYEIENAIKILGTNRIVLMHGFQNYPTNYKDINFRRIKKIMQLYPEFEHGYADHTAFDDKNNILITLLGAAMGMDYIEKHVTNVYGEERIDWQSAISFEMFNDLAEKILFLNDCLGNGLLVLNEEEKKYSVYGPNKKAPITTKDLKAGKMLKKNDITFKRTAQITDISQIEINSFVGKKIKKDIKKGHCLKREDFDY